MILLTKIFKYLMFLFVIFNWYHHRTMAIHPRYYLKWKSFDCDNDMPHFANIICRIEPMNAQKISADMTIVKPINVIWTKIVLSVLRPLQNTYTTLLEGNFNACKIIKDGKMGNKLFEQIYRNMLKHSNQPKQCPVNVGPLHYHNISALDNLPAFLPEMDFKFNITYYMPNIPKSFNMTLTASLMELRRVRQKV